MSTSVFDQIFTALREKFPPVSKKEDAVLKLSTQDFLDSFETFSPGIELPLQGITGLLIEQGYKYEPFSVNDRIVFYWLVGETD